MYKFKMHISDLDGALENLTQFHMKFTSDFRTKTRSVEQHSFQYLHIFFEQSHSKGIPNKYTYIVYKYI